MVGGILIVICRRLPQHFPCALTVYIGDFCLESQISKWGRLSVAFESARDTGRNIYLYPIEAREADVF